MTTTTIADGPTSEEESTGPAQPTYGQLREILADFEKATESINVFANKADDREAIWQLALPWLPLAEKKLGEAEGSPSHQAHWQEIIAGVQRPPAGAESVPDVGTLLHSAWWLLNALLAAAARGPSVREIADRVRELITNGTYPPGSRIGIGRIAAEVGCPSASTRRVRLATRDLEAEGLVTFTPSDRVRVADTREVDDRPTQIAAWLRVLIQAGVYPPGSNLPPRPDLARGLVSPPPFVTRALHLLHDDSVITPSRKRGVRPTVQTTLPFPVVPPPDLDSLFPRLLTLALPDADLSHTGIRQMCNRSHTWWRSRLTPHPETLRHTHRALAAAAEFLIPLAQSRHPNNPDVYATLRRTAVTALAAVPSDSGGQSWRAACLGAAVLEVLNLAGDDV